MHFGTKAEQAEQVGGPGAIRRGPGVAETRSGSVSLRSASTRRRRFHMIVFKGQRSILSSSLEM